MSIFSAEADVYMIAGLAIMGAVVLVVIPFILRRRRVRQSLVTAGMQSAGVEHKPPWRKKRDIVRQTRDYLRKVRFADGAPTPAGGDPSGSLRKRGVSPPVAAADAALPVGKASLPQAAGPAPDADSEPSTQAEGMPDTEGASEERRTGSVLDAFTEERTEPEDQAALLEEDGDSKEDEDEDLGDVFGGKDASKSGDPDSLFELFTTETTEDNEAGKLAASLEDVDTRDLLAEAQQVLNEVRGVAEAWRRSVRR